MKKLLLTAIVCVFAMFGTLKAQNTEVVIDGTVGSYSEYMTRFAPVFVGVQYSISQQYYTAEEIGMEEGIIKSLAFKTDMTWYADSRMLEVYMVNTENSVFNGLTMEQVASEDLVFTGNVKFAPNSWVTIDFDKGFNYTGGNVLVCVNDLTTQMCYNDSYFESFLIPEEKGTRCIWNSSEEMYFDPTASAIEAKEKVMSVPFVKFAFGEVGEKPEQPGDAIEESTLSFNVYPNPVNGVLFIETEAEINEVSIFDVYGRQQVNMTTGQQVDVKNLNSGVYFVKVVTENAEVVKRFVKK